MKRPVLILGDEPRVALTIARSLDRRGIAVDVAGLSQETPRLRSRTIRSFVRLPGNLDRPGEFRSALEQITSDNLYDMIIPSSDTALALVAGCYDAFGDRLRIACPAPRIVGRVLDKDVTLQIAEGCGIAVPRTYPIKDSTGLEAMRDSLRFPIVAKDRSKSLVKRSSFKVRYFGSFQDLSEAFRADPELGSRVLLQEYCHGVGVGIALLVHRARVIAAFQHRRLKEFPITGGVAVSAVSEPLDPILFRGALELLRAIEWEGIAMVEFRQDRSEGRTVLMEVNGRYWGTCSLAVRCGIDFPFYEWQLAHDEVPEVPESYSIGRTWRWTAGYLQGLHDRSAVPGADPSSPSSIWREWLGVVRDLGPWRSSALESLRDPLPGLIEPARTVKALVVRDTKRILRRLLPQRLKSHLEVASELELGARRLYLWLQARRLLGLGRNRCRPTRLAMARSFLFVCHGNIIRSPLASALLKRALVQRGQTAISVTSAGLGAKQGRSADERVIQAARELGVSLDEHRAQSLTAKLVAEADVIFVMDFRNEAVLLARFPEAKAKVSLLTYSCDHGHPSEDKEIADPYRGSLDDVRQCGRVIRSYIQGLSGGMASMSSNETPRVIGRGGTAL